MASKKESEKQFTSVFKKFPNRFLLAVGLSKRAKQLKEGVKPLVDVAKGNELLSIDTALDEFMHEEVTLVMKEEENNDEEMLDEMDQILDAEIEEDLAKEEDKKSKDKGGKMKKSLAA